MKVLIIGGGPAGLACAKSLAERGHEVFLVEKGNIGEPVRTSGGIVVNEFKRVYPNIEGLYKPVRRGGFILDDGTVYEVSFDGDILGVLDVRGLYQKLAEEAIDAGAIIETHATAIDVRLSKDGVKAVKVSMIDGEHRIEADVFIEATGASARLINKIRPRRYRLAVGIEIDARVKDDRTRIILGDSTKGGYGRVFNRKEGRSRIGGGVILNVRRPNLSSLLKRIVRIWSEAVGEELRGYIEVHSGTFNAGGLREDYHVGNVIAIGDAGGFGSPVYGEGIRFAIESGYLCYKELEEPGYLLRYRSSKYESLYKYGVKAQTLAARLGTKDRKTILDALRPGIEEDPRRLEALMKFDLSNKRLREKLMKLGAKFIKYL